MPLFSKDAPDPAAVVRAAAYPLTTDHDHERILAEIGGASLVLIGEATHGTHDFYSLRARITRALIEERGFSAVAIEGDWPDAYRVNRYVQNTGNDVDAISALSGFARFPTWMWRNTAVADFVGWLRAHNAGIPAQERRVGFYKLDLYSLHASMRAVIAATDWGEPGRLRQVRPALNGSYEELFHRTGMERFFIAIEKGTYVHSLLAEPRLERAIGVIYRPETERWSHYFNARLADQFDAIIHIDHTRGVEPLEHIAAWEAGEAPETFPSGI